MRKYKFLSVIATLFLVAPNLMCVKPKPSIDASEYIASANAKAKQGDYDGAMQDYSAAIKIDPENVNAYNNRGYLKQIQGVLTGAIDDYSRAIEINPKFAEAYFNRGCAYQRQMKLKKALKDFDKTLEINPEYPAALYRRGIARFDIDDQEGSIADFVNLIMLIGRDDQMAKYAYLRICVLKWKRGFMAKSIIEARAYANEAPGNKWEDVLIKFVAGLIDEQTLINTTESGELQITLERQCEAYFYIAQLRLANGDREGAIEGFKNSISTEVDYFTEYYSSIYEFKRLLAK